MYYCFNSQSVVRNATTQAQVEMFEQEMTRMKLKHQLDVKVSQCLADPLHSLCPNSQTR